MSMVRAESEHFYAAGLRHNMMLEPIIIFLGPVGTYTHQAAYDRFSNAGEFVKKSSVADVFSSLSSREIGVVPQENTTFGSVIETYDCLRQDHLPYFVRGEITLAIQHCLLVRKGTRFEDIDRIMSHEQALGQCDAFIKEHFPNATLNKTPSTAAAADALLSGPPTLAAICSKICVTVFPGTEILREGIQDKKSNFTRFLVITRDEQVYVPSISAVDAQSAMLRISLSSKCPEVKISDVFSAMSLDVTRIDRRPSVSGAPFHDTYLVEVVKPSDLYHPGGWRGHLKERLERTQTLGVTEELVGFW